MTYDTAIDPYIKAALGKKALGLVVLDVGKLTSIADYFIICSGRSNRQVTAIAEHIQITLKEQGIRPLSVEGAKSGHWALMDYGHVIIHVFYDSIRNFYDLEGLWADARRIKTPDMIAFESADASSPDPMPDPMSGPMNARKDDRESGEKIPRGQDPDEQEEIAPKEVEVQDGI
jgi:ribosome-associated protein